MLACSTGQPWWVTDTVTNWWLVLIRPCDLCALTAIWIAGTVQGWRARLLTPDMGQALVCCNGNMNKVANNHCCWSFGTAAFIQPDQHNPWIKDQIKSTVLSTTFSPWYTIMCRMGGTGPLICPKFCDSSGKIEESWFFLSRSCWPLGELVSD